MNVRKSAVFVTAGFLLIALFFIIRIFGTQTAVLGERIALADPEGKSVVLDFNTPTPSPTPSPSPSPTPTPSPSPSPTPSPTPYPVTGQQMDTWFTQYANHYSIDRNQLWHIAVCETGLRANAVNGIYGGMFQFSSNTWISNRKTMNLDPNPDLRFNPEEAIKTAAFVLSTRGSGAWPNCRL